MKQLSILLLWLTIGCASANVSSSSSSAPVDNLAYTYDGNRIASVNGMQYSHDANGNVTEDGYHETETSYNLLNLPCRVENPESTLYYSYIADGTKVAMTADDGSGYAYAGDMVFTRSAQGAYSFESMAYGNGRIEGSSNTVRNYVTDHLGNVRAVVTDGQVVERNDYYPFGGRHPRNTLPVLSSNRWRLGAKETQPPATGSLVDFGARMYDPFTGRWTIQDPMAWKYVGMSPYNYCGNDPVNLVDPDGLSTSTHTDGNGNVIAVINDGDYGIYKHVNMYTDKDVLKVYTLSNKSAGGEYMGDSWQIDSFRTNNQNKPMKIDFGSLQLTDIANSIMNEKPSIVRYGIMAQSGGDWDVKIHITSGSLLYGKYASPRDAGNFIAGMFSQSKGKVASYFIDFGYGAYNICGNKNVPTALLCFFVLGSHHAVPMMDYIGQYGEDPISKNAQMLGKHYYKMNY